jgi:hypothetical protein
MSTAAEMPPHNADIDRTSPQPEIHVEERRLTLHDFLKTSVKINGSDIHLQADSVPMIRVDGRARFLDVPPLTDELMTEYVEKVLEAQTLPTPCARASRDFEPTYSTAAKNTPSLCGESSPRFQTLKT